MSAVYLRNLKYASQLRNTFIELQPTDTDPAAINQSIIFRIHKKFVGNDTIQLIQQQSIDILQQSNKNGSIYLWVAFSDSIDLVHWDITTTSSNKNEYVGYSILSFSRSKKFGNLSKIQSSDSRLGPSTLASFHFISVVKSDTIVTVIPIDAYMVLDCVQQIRLRSHTGSTATANVLDLSLFECLTVIIPNDMSETRSLIDSSSVRHWSPTARDHISGHHFNPPFTNIINWQDAIISSSASSYSFQLLVQNRNNVKKVMKYTTARQRVGDCIQLLGVSQVFSNPSVVIDFQPIANDDDVEEKVVMGSSSTGSTSPLSSSSMINTAAGLWESCIAFNMIPSERLQVLSSTYPHSTSANNSNSNDNDDISYQRAVVFEVVMAVGLGQLIADYINKTNSSSGTTDYILEDVGRVHKWAMDYKNSLDKCVRDSVKDTVAPLLLHRAPLSSSTDGSFGSDASDITEVSLNVTSLLYDYQITARSLLLILKALRQRKIDSFADQNSNNTQQQQQQMMMMMLDRNYAMEEHSEFICHISCHIVQVETMLTLLDYCYNCICFSSDITITTTSKLESSESLSSSITADTLSFSFKSLLPHPNSVNNSNISPLQEIMTVDRYASTSDKGYLYFTPVELQMKYTIYDFFTKRLTSSLSSSALSLAAVDMLARYNSLFAHITNNGSNNMSLQLQQVQCLAQFLLIPLDTACLINTLLPTAPIIMSDYSSPSLFIPSISVRDAFVDTSPINEANQLLLYISLDAMHTILDSTIATVEVVIYNSNRSNNSMNITVGGDDDEILKYNHQHHEMAERNKHRNHTILLQLTRVADMIASALNLNTIQMKYIFNLWKCDAGFDVLYATDELCRQIYGVEKQADVYEILIQRLLAINSEESLKAVQNLIHYFVNNEEAVGIMLNQGIVFSINNIGETNMISKVGFGVVALAASYLNKNTYVYGWQMCRRMCDSSGLSAYNKILVRRRVALLLCKWSALSGYLQEFLSFDLDQNEFAEVENYLQSLAQQDILTARDPSSTVQLLYVWLMQHKRIEKAVQIHEQHKAACIRAAEIKAIVTTSKITTTLPSSPSITNRQHLLDAYLTLPTVAEEYFHPTEPRPVSTSTLSLLDTRYGLEAFQPASVTSVATASESSSNEVSTIMMMNELNLNIPIRRSKEWFTEAFDSSSTSASAAMTGAYQQPRLYQQTSRQQQHAPKSARKGESEYID